MNVKTLLRKMTVEEKVMQLCAVAREELLDGDRISSAKSRKILKHGIGFIAGLTRDFKPREGAEALNEVQRYLIDNTRLGIPAVMHEECLHGPMAREATIFPQSIGMGATWDPALYGRVAEAIGKEARARGFSLALSPTINIARDPRCGRTEETYGEDTFLTIQMALAFIKALQSNGVGTTPKHFVANFVGDGGRDSFDIAFSERILREVYFPAFKAAVQEGKATAIMPAYNTLDGIPCAANAWLLIDILRKEWGFDGITGSDYGSIDSMMARQFVARDKAECARKALLGGMDVEWPNSSTYPELIREVKAGRVPMKALDQSVERVLRLKDRMKVFSRPFADVGRSVELSNCDEHRDIAREAAARSMVLLKNDRLLPLKRNLRQVAVIGPNANTIRTGGYSSTGAKVVTPLAGLRAKLGAERVLYAKGCENHGGTKAGINRAVKAAKKADAVILCVGNWSGGSWWPEPFTEGEGRDRSSLKLAGVQEDLVNAVAKANKNTVVVIIGGSAVVMENWLDKVKAVVMAWYPGCEGGTALADTLLGYCNPGGRLPLTFPVREGQIPCYYNIKPTGRRYDYVDLRGEQAQFAFGHGLSYTRFAYSGLRVNKIRGGVRVRCAVKNTGRRAGDEVVQLYVHDKYNTTVTRPLKELKGFKRISLAAGKSERVEFTLTHEDLSHLGEDLKPVFERGEFELMIGGSSADLRLRRTVKI